MARIDPDDPRPPYLQIADDLRRTISSGALAPGKRVGSSRELATAYGVAPMTVHQAIRVLRDEGLVDSYQGRGVFVRDESAVREPDLATQVVEIRQQVDELVAHVSEGVDGELAELRRQLGVLQGQLMELYGRTGNVYPHDQVQNGAAHGRRRATGS